MPAQVTRNHRGNTALMNPGATDTNQDYANTKTNTQHESSMTNEPSLYVVSIALRKLRTNLSTMLIRLMSSMKSAIMLSFGARIVRISLAFSGVVHMLLRRSSRQSVTKLQSLRIWKLLGMSAFSTSYVYLIS